MATAERLTVRIRFETTTRDDEGRTTHRAGEEIVGELMRKTGDFLLIRTASGGCMCVDASRLDLFCVELDPEDLVRPLKAVEVGHERNLLKVA